MSMVDPRNPTNESVEASPYKDDGATVAPNINLKTVEFLDYFGMQDEMFNSDVMDKVNYLTERMDINELREIDLSLAHDDTARIDKIYAYHKILDQEHQIRKEEQLLREQRRRLML